MAKKRKKYLVTKNSEAYACSLVTSPAVEETFVVFNEETPIIEKFADEKKHMITGVVAIPQKPIYRRNADGEEYDIVFSEEAIESMAKDFMKNYRQHEVTLQHEENADGVYLVEQWIKSDMVYDKSIAMGLSRELPVGSWIQTYYVDSNDVWQRIVNGELLGFSLECMLGLEEFEAQFEKNNEENMNIENQMSYWTKFKEVLTEVFTSMSMNDRKEEEVELHQEPLEEPKAVEEPKAEEPVVEEPKTVEEPKVEEPKEEPKAEEPKQDANEQLQELIKSLKEEINALKESNSGLQEKVKELGKQPSAKPIKTVSGNGGDTYSSWRETMRGLIG